MVVLKPSHGRWTRMEAVGMEQAHLRGNWEMKSSGSNDGLDSGGQGGRVWGSTKDDSCVSGM